MQEVRNPNGDFNDNQGAASYHAFDYAPDDYVNLTAGNQVQLGVPSTASLSPPRIGVEVPHSQKITHTSVFRGDAAALPPSS